MLAMLGMAYLYFSNLNRETSYNEISLHAATANSGLIFCMEDDKNIFEILKGQDFFQKIIGEDKFNQLKQLKDQLTTSQSLNNLIAHKNIFISFTTGKSQEIDYLISTQLNNEEDKPKFMEAMKLNRVNMENAGQVVKLTLNDSTTFYLAIEKNLILLSNAASPVQAGIKASQQKTALEFTAFIKSNSKPGRNSVGNLYIDFSRLPALIKTVLPGTLSGSLAILAKQNSFSALNYNFSKERLFFNGTTKVNDKNNYLNLYTNLKPQKNDIDNLLPDNTANFRLFSIPGYKLWRKSLNALFILNKEDAAAKKIISNTNSIYHLNADEIFPEYFKNQLICFQLNTSENIAAINLSNGDKVKQLLLDISEDYDEDIKRLKVHGLLYCYFGEPLKKFSSPYYTIIDNYMVFSNQGSAIKIFLNKYRSNSLLINDANYMALYSQISGSANITIYANRKNSVDLARNTVYSSYYKHLISAKGLGNFGSFIYQLSGDRGNFQTNLLINTLYKTENENLTPN